MIKCPMCNKDNDDRASACGSCGATLSTVAEQRSGGESSTDELADFMPGVRTIKAGGIPAAAEPSKKKEAPEKKIASPQPPHQEARDEAAVPRLEDLLANPQAAPGPADTPLPPPTPPREEQPATTTQVSHGDKKGPSATPAATAPSASELKPLEQTVRCKECDTEVTPQSIKIHQGRSLCLACYKKLTAPLPQTRIANLTVPDIRQLLRHPVQYLFNSSYRGMPLPFLSFLLVGSLVYFLVYYFLVSLDEPNTSFGRAIGYYFSNILFNIINTIPIAGITLAGVATAHLVGKKLGGRGNFKEILNLGAMIYGLVYHLECAALILLLPFSVLLSGDLVALENTIRVPFHLYAGTLLFLGVKRIHWFDIKKTAIAVVPAVILILALTYSYMRYMFS